MKNLKTSDPDIHSTASEPALHQRATTESGTCRKRRSDTEIDDLPALKEKALCLIATVLCKSNASGIRRISLFVLTIFRRKFERKFDRKFEAS